MRKPDWYDSPYLKPLPAPGLYFHRRSIQGFDILPRGCFAYGASWFPIDTDRPDQPACHVVVEVDAKRNFYLTECYNQPGATLEDAMERLFLMHEGIERATVLATQYPIKANIYGVRTWFVMREQFEVIEPIFQERCRAYRRQQIDLPRLINITPLPGPTNIMAMAKGLQSNFLRGSLKLDQKADWKNELLSELCQWPITMTSARLNALAVATAAMPDMQGPAPSAAPTPRGGSQWTA